MTVSIIICTRNRAQSLRATLLAIGHAYVPPQWDVELLVVDNGSTDCTREVIEEVRLANLQLRYISEPTPGQSHARNTGLAQSTGEVILFTDDDVRVPSNWIEGMCRPILDNASDAVAGGVVFPAEIAAALSRPPFSSRKSWFASTEELDRKAPNRMVGANMAFHRRILDKVPSFDIELGPGALGFADETLFSKQLLAAGYRLVGAPDVAAEHHFDLKRITKDELLNLAGKMGRTNAFLFHHWAHRDSHLLLPRFLLCKIHLVWVRRRNRRVADADGNVPESVVRLEEQLAFYRELMIQRHRPRKYASR
jgi:glucosyl-dolichyl phosphate glucuronosyltransferase